MGHFVIDFLSAALNLVCLYAVSTMLEPKNKALYWGLQVAALVGFAFIRTDVGPLERTALTLLLAVVLPVALTRGNVLHRLLVVSLCLAVLFVAEFFGNFVWIFITGAPTMDYGAAWAHLPETLFARTACIVLSVALYAGLRRLMNRQGAGAVRTALFVGFPLVQVVLLTVGVAVGNGLFAESGAFYGAATAAALVCVAADVTLFRSMERYQRRQDEERRAEALARQLAWGARQNAEIQESLGSVAKFRHDIRNQLQAIAVLVERGECILARNQLQALKARMDAEGQGGIFGMEEDTEGA